MPRTNYLQVRIGNRIVDVEQNESLPVAINYALEDQDSFGQKPGSSSFDVTLPATQNNSQTFNTPHNPTVEDLTSDSFFTSHEPCTIEASGVQLLVGKAFLKQATHTDKALAITVNCYGDNADWVIDLKDATLLDFVQAAIHTFDAATIENGWATFDGTSEGQDFVYAPVRYGLPFRTLGVTTDMVATPFEMKPAISPYWIMWRAFQSLGYKINSNFLDSNYFRRQVMPWTWGSFLFTDDTLFAPYKFRALCTHRERVVGMSGSWNEWVSPASVGIAEVLSWTDVSTGGALGGFEGTPGLYSFLNNHNLSYTYPAGSVLGPVAMGFELQVYYAVTSAGGISSWGLRAFWFINLATVVTDPFASGISADAEDDIALQTGSGTAQDSVTITREFNLQPGDRLTCILRVDASSGTQPLTWNIGAPYPAIPTSNGYPSSYFANTYIKKALGSPVSFKQYPAFQNYKFLDMLRGLIDFYNLSVNTDPIAKVVTMEPTYPYSVDNNRNNLQPGYFKAERVDWTAKQDLSKESIVELYADNEREFDFKFRDDGNDGGLQILNKRYAVAAADSRYLFPDRFQAGSKDYTNRFFSPIVHVVMKQWGGITNVAPQLIALVPENISSASKAEDQNNFQPKLAYYKGQIPGVGGWIWQPDPNDVSTQVQRSLLPFMFAVNYNPGGEADPILTYNDQLITGATSGSAAVTGDGLMRRFFLPRLAIMRHGKRYTTWMNLNLRDITNWSHREAVIIGNSIYYNIGISGFKPLADDSTQVLLWKYWPITQADVDNCFPSIASVTGATATLGASDLKYARLLILSTDLPQE